MTAERTHARGATLWDHLAIILKWRKLFTIVLGLVAVASVVYALMATQWYQADARVLPPPQNNMGLGNLLPGLNLGAIGAGSLAPNEATLAMNILESRGLRDDVIDQFNWMQREKFDKREDAYDRYSDLVSWELTEDGAIHIIVQENDPKLAAETANFIVDKVSKEYTVVSNAQASNQKNFIEKRIDENRAELRAAEDTMKAFQKQTGVISLEDQLKASVEAIAQINTQLVLAEVQLEVYKKTLPESSSEVLMAEQQVKALRDKLNALNSKSENDSRQFFISIDVAPDVGVQYLRLQRELESKALIMQFLLPQLEQAKILESKDTSNMYVLDHARVPDKRIRPRRAFVVLGSLFVAFVILYIFVAFIEWFHRLRDKDPERYQVVQDVLTTLNPKHFFGRSPASFDE